MNKVIFFALIVCMVSLSTAAFPQGSTNPLLITGARGLHTAQASGNRSVSSIPDGVLISKSPTSMQTPFLYRMRSDGSGMRPIVTVDSGSNISYARWSDDLRAIIYVSNNSSNGQQQLFIADSSGNSTRQLTSVASPYNVGAEPDFASPTKVWYSLQEPGWSEIYEIDTDGTGNSQISNGAAEGKEYNCTRFNPHRTRTFFCKTTPYEGPTAELYSADLDYSNQQQLTNNSTTDYEFDVSADGSRIVWCEETPAYSGIFNIFVMNSDGSNQTAITQYTDGSTCYPSWSPDGTRILYSRYDGTQWDIHAIDSNGTNDVNVTNTPDYNEFVWDWRGNARIQVSLPTVIAHQQDTIEVAVTGAMPPGSSYSSTELSFGGFQHNGLSFLGLDTMSCMMNNKGWQIQFNNTDTLLITASAGDQDISGSGVLFDLKFVVTGSPCTFVPITITKAVFNTGVDPVAVSNGGVDIKAIPVYGDVDGNGQIQAYDASLVLKGLVGIDTLSCQALANAIVNCDTVLSAYDATLILQNVVGLVTLPHCASIIASGTLAAENVASLGGRYVDVPLVLSNGNNILSFEGEICYHTDRLEFDSITWAPSLTSFTPLYKDNKGIVKFAGAYSQEDGHTGMFATLHFKFQYTGAIDTVTVRNIRWNGKSPTNITFILDVPKIGKELPKEFALGQNYPNPFNPTTSIRFALPKSSYVTLKVFNLLGQEVTALVNQELQAGYHDVTWDASDMSSGMYFYRLQAGNFIETKKLLLLK